MGRALVFALAALAAGCGAGTGDGSPVSCDEGDIAGTYLFEYTETSGDCGPVPGALAILGDGMAEPGDAVGTCIIGDVARDACGVTYEAGCMVDSITWVESVTTIEQASDDGARLRGVHSATVYDDLTGTVLCAGTYDVDARRQ